MIDWAWNHDYRPTPESFQPGWYFLRRHKEPKSVWMTYLDTLARLDIYCPEGGDWCGPVPLPKET